jgi:hypothetical protein
MRAKKIGGAEYTLNKVFPQQNFQLTKGTVNMYTYIGDSGNSPSQTLSPTMIRPSGKTPQSI